MRGTSLEINSHSRVPCGVKGVSFHGLPVLASETNGDIEYSMSWFVYVLLGVQNPDSQFMWRFLVSSMNWHRLRNLKMPSVLAKTLLDDYM